MPLGELGPTVVAMNDSYLLRVGAVAAVVGAGATLVATVLEPDVGDEPGEAIRVVAESGFWTGGRLLDLIGIFLSVGALTVVGRTFAEGPGRGWARGGQPFLVLMGALGTSAVLTGATLEEVADAWVGASPQAKQSYLAVFDFTASVTDALFFGAFMAMGLYLAALATAILTQGVYRRWIGWVSAVSAGLVLSGDLLVLVSESAFIAVLVGYVLYKAVLVALGVSMWRQAAAPVGQRRASPAADARLA
jgi:hypothetical protein